MLSLNRHEEAFEVAYAEALVVFSLDELVEESGPILLRLCEDLEEVPVLVEVDQNAELFELFDVLFDAEVVLLELLQEDVVVGGRGSQELKSSFLVNMRD